MLLILFCLLFNADGIHLAKLHNTSVSLGGISATKINNSDLMSQILSFKDDNKALLSVLSDADPARLNEVITLLKGLLTTSQAELDGITASSNNADTAFTDAVAAHNAAKVAQTNGLNTLASTKGSAIDTANTDYNEGVTALQDAVDAAKGLVDSTNSTKITANALLAADSARLNSEISTLTTVIELLEGLLGINTVSPTSSPTANPANPGVVSIVAVGKLCQHGQFLPTSYSTPDALACMNLLLGRQDCNHDYFSYTTSRACFCASLTDDCSLMENQGNYGPGFIYKVGLQETHGWGPENNLKTCGGVAMADERYDSNAIKGKTYNECKELCAQHWGCNCIQYSPNPTFTSYCRRRRNCHLDKCTYHPTDSITLWDRPPMNCDSAHTVHVKSTNHPNEGDNGKYFFIDDAEWTAMAGSASSAVVKQTGSHDWIGKVSVWKHDPSLGFYGARQSWPNAGQWATGDTMKLCVQPASLGGR